MTVIPLIKKVVITLTSAACLVAISEQSSHALTFNETGDAGQLLSTSQAVGGGFTTIAGQLSTDTDVDLFRFNWGGGLFSASTSTTPAESDTQLFLFNSLGTIIAEDDDSGPGVLSFLQISNLAGGLYYLGISAFDSDPLNAAGDDIEEILRFDRPGDRTLAGWRLDNDTDAPFDYQIQLSAATIPTPALLPGLIGMGIAAIRKRKAETVAESQER